MDPRIGILEQGDILIEDGVIAQIAPSIPVTDAEIIDATDHIVAPGLIDTHRHTWQALLRGLATDMTTSEYLVRVRFGISRAYQPADIKLGNTLGALDALNGGVTTILDFSHSINTPAMLTRRSKAYATQVSARCSATASSKAHLTHLPISRRCRACQRL